MSRHRDGSKSGDSPRQTLANRTKLGPSLQLWARGIQAGNTKGGSITVPLTSCLTGLDGSVLKIKTKIVNCRTADSKPVKQEVNGTVILPLLVFPDTCMPFIACLMAHLHGS